MDDYSAIINLLNKAIREKNIDDEKLYSDYLKILQDRDKIIILSK